jgi:hypothetical protein
LKANLHDIKRSYEESVYQKSAFNSTSIQMSYLAINPAAAPAMTTWLFEPLIYVSMAAISKIRSNWGAPHPSGALRFQTCI